MTELTKAQRELLEGAPAKIGTLSGNCWRVTPEGYSVRVNRRTLDAAILRGYLELDHVSSSNTVAVYALSDAGRAALQGGKP